MRDLTPAELRERVPQACQVATAAPVELELRAGGAAITPARRDELLAALAAGTYVELEIDLLAFEQETGKRNRNCVRFRDGMLVALGRSGKGTPFLRDHAQGDLLARGGTIIASSTVKVAEGHYQIRQTVKVTVPWAVEAVLRGTLDRFSIGWNPTGDVLCSACNKAIFTRCYHFPGDRLREHTDEDGGKRLVRDRAGDVVVEWVFTEAELVETSAVSVPAVPSAHIDSIRAALSALRPVGEEPSGENPHEEDMLKSKLITLLALAATASDDEISNAVESQGTRLRLTEGQRDELAKKNAELSARQAVQEAAAAKLAEDAFIEGAVRVGKLAPGGKLEAEFRKFFQLDAAGARAMLEGMPATTPVGAPRQSVGGDPTPPTGPGTELASVDQGLREYGASPAGVRKVLAQLGSDPSKVLSKYGAQALGLTTTQQEG